MFYFSDAIHISYFLYYVSQSIFMFSFLDVVFVINKDFSYCVHLETLSHISPQIRIILCQT